MADAPIRKFSQSIDVAWSPGQPSGKPQLSQITLERDSSEGSPAIDHTLSMGKGLASASIVIGNLTIELTKVNVMGVSMATPRGARAQEAINLTYATVTYTWTEPNKAVRSTTYDVAKNVGGSAVTQAFTYGYFPPASLLTRPTPPSATSPIRSLRRPLAPSRSSARSRS